MVDFPITFYIREVFGRLSPGAQRLGGGLTSGNETTSVLDDLDKADIGIPASSNVARVAVGQPAQAAYP